MKRFFRRSYHVRWYVCVIAPMFLVVTNVGAQQAKPVSEMSFFITSVGPGRGGNLGGLAGADAHCQQLAQAVGAGKRVWRAYLSSPATADRAVVHARDRIGRGPWLNAKGARVAENVAELHRDDNTLGIVASLDEKGNIVARNRHDMLTGSNRDGSLATGAPDTTCGGWTSSSAGRARLGHHDKSGGGEFPESWNSAHLSDGCSQQELRSTLSDGLFYCFAEK